MIIISSHARFAANRTAKHVLNNEMHSQAVLQYVYVAASLPSGDNLYTPRNNATRENIVFYRRCMRFINYLFQCPTNELDHHVNLPTIEDRFKRYLRKRLVKIQLFELTLIHNVPQAKNLHNKLRQRSREKRKLLLIPQGRPSKRFITLSDHTRPTFLDLLGSRRKHMFSNTVASTSKYSQFTTR